MSYLILILFLSFIIGSLPTAYLVLKYYHDKDIRREGSGNIGAMNAFEVTNSKSHGLLILLIDLAKGAGATLLARYLYDGFYVGEFVATVAVVAGHNFSPWVGFKGGRGLSPAAGAALIISPLLVVYWAIAWSIFRPLTGNVHWSNVSASTLLPVIVWAAPSLTLVTSFSKVDSITPLLQLVIAVSFLILVKHIDPIRQLLSKQL